MKIPGLAAAAAFLALGLAAPADASMRYVVFRGTIDSGTDYAGAFGAAGDLALKSYAIIYGFDPSRGVDRTNSYSEELLDGFSLGRSEPNPIVFLSVGVDGHFIDGFRSPAPGGAVATYDAYTALGFAGVGARFASGAAGESNSFNNVVYTFSAPTRLSTDYRGVNAGYYPGGPLGRAEQHNGSNDNLAYEFWMRPERVIITSDFAAAIPEPAGWALMIAGFGLAGSGLRRHRALSLS